MSLQRHEYARPRPQFGAAPPRRATGREGGQILTVGFRRYVEAILRADEPSLSHDLDVTLDLVQDIMEYERRPEIDAALIAAYGSGMRQLATTVRRTGRGAAAHPALLARAIVMARTLDRTAAGRRAALRQRAESPMLQVA